MEHRIWLLAQMCVACMISLTFFAFLPLITIYAGTLLCGDFNSNNFSYLVFIILLINSLQVCGAFPLLVCTIIKLGHRITYENPEVVNVTKQSFRTAWPYCSTESFCFLFLFWVSLITRNLLQVHYLYWFFFVILFQLYFFPSLHDEHFETNDEKISCRIDE